MNKESRKKSNRLRIIGGDWRSRVLDFPDAPGLRPTPDRVRETLFNWLQFDITGARCLDLFAGSGALGFEALSRGAGAVTAIEQDPAAAKALQVNAAKLNTGKLQVLQTNALHWLEHTLAEPFDIIFIDPPFSAGLHQRSLDLLAARQWLKPHGIIYLEAGEALDSFALPSGLELYKAKRAGDVNFGLLSARQ